jgi:hypothetical protein
MAKPPEKLYVVVRTDGNKNTLGNLWAYNPARSTFPSKKRQLDAWAYNYLTWGDHYIHDMEIEDHGNGLVFLVGYREVRNPSYSKSPGQPIRLKIPHRELLEKPPQIWDNVPTYGFKLREPAPSTKPTQLWRVVDPRGIEFELSAVELQQIIQDAQILKGGVIDAKCVWQASRKLRVVP